MRPAHSGIEVVVPVTVTAVHQFGRCPVIYKRVGVDFGVLALRLDRMVRGIISIEEQSQIQLSCWPCRP